MSEGCAHCYAETQSGRNPEVLGRWGKDAARSYAAESYYENILRVHRACRLAGERKRVFCGSLMDVWEWRTDLHPLRARLFDLIARTPFFDWLLLSKRPENWHDCLIAALPHCTDRALDFVQGWLGEYYMQAGTYDVSMLPARTVFEPQLPTNVWFGWTVENQRRVDERCRAGLIVPAAEHFVSLEPLLDFPDIKPYLNVSEGNRITWAIVGGESGGKKARPFNPDWGRVILDECSAAGCAFFFKQMGDNPTSGPTLAVKDGWDGIPHDCRVRNFPLGYYGRNPDAFAALLGSTQ